MSVTRRGAIILSGLGLITVPQGIQGLQGTAARNPAGTITGLASSAVGATTTLDANLAGQFSKASDPITYLDNVCLLCEFPVREKGENLWPQGISINKADNELYVSNSDGPATLVRLDVET